MTESAGPPRTIGWAGVTDLSGGVTAGPFATRQVGGMGDGSGAFTSGLDMFSLAGKYSGRQVARSFRIKARALAVSAVWRGLRSTATPAGSWYSRTDNISSLALCTAASASGL